MLGNQQKLALQYMIDGCNCFITGSPGTGKTSTINRFIEYCKDHEKNVVVCAPTGIAAININGVTAHRLFNLPLSPAIDAPKSIPSTLKEADVVIIDEISMLRVDYFDYICYMLIALNKYRRRSGLNDIQIILSGDFFQLPPVIPQKDRELLNSYKYMNNLGNGFAFRSQYWSSLGLVTIVLTEVFRQSNNEFIQALGALRYGDIRAISYFNQNYNKHEIKDAILLCSTNKKANAKNSYEFNKLKTPISEYIAEVKGNVLESDKIVPEHLKLRVGCRVMSVVNSGNTYQNGSFGYVKALATEYVTVLFDNGNLVNIERYTWDINSYATDKNGKAKLSLEGSYSQFPLKLAYAITIHKSQGQTYDSVNLDPYCWDCGQLYVALSRVKTIDGMHLTELIQPRYLVTSREVINFYNTL